MPSHDTPRYATSAVLSPPAADAHTQKQPDLSRIETKSKRLLQRLAEGDPSAFWDLWEVHQQDLYRLCLRHMSGSQMDAEDALSRAMLKAFEKLPAYAKQIASLKAWLARLTHNVCIDIHRYRARSELRVESIEAADAAIAVTETDIESPESAVAQRERSTRLLRALKDLPSRLRDPFVLRFLHDLEYTDIAALLNLTPANVRKRIQQAREKLRETLSKST